MIKMVVQIKTRLLIPAFQSVQSLSLLFRLQFAPRLGKHSVTKVWERGYIFTGYHKYAKKGHLPRNSQTESY